MLCPWWPLPDPPVPVPPVPPPVVEVVVLLVVVVVDDDRVVAVGVVLRVVVEELVVGAGDVVTVTVLVPAPHPANRCPAASARAANAAGRRLMSLRRARAGGARSKDSR